MSHSGILLCGVDEAGRGPLCGPVVAAAVVLDPECPILGLADSKKLTHKRRVQLAELIKKQALFWAVAQASVAEIDQLNILHATMLAMRRAIEAIKISDANVEAIIDGNRIPTGLKIPARFLVQGDALEPCISAASILAKTHRDALLVDMDALYPQYGFAVHKGYPTAAHLKALRVYGASPEHRRSFAPVARVIEQISLFGDHE